MRIVRATAAACIAAAMAVTYIQAQPQDADRKVAGGGVTVKGWQGKEDAGNKQGLTVNDSKFAPGREGLPPDDRSGGALLEPGEHRQG